MTNGIKYLRADVAQQSIAELEAAMQEAREDAAGWRDQMARDLGRHLEREAVLEAQLSEATKDADRYRWLRDSGGAVLNWTDEYGFWWSINTPHGAVIKSTRLDAAIDAARSADREGEKA